MADRAISVLMESRYKSDLSKQLYKDEQRMKRFEERLKRNPLVIPVRLDLKGAMTQAAALRKAILGEFARMPTSILGADGRPATSPASGGREMNKRAGVLSTTEFQKADRDGNLITERIQQVEQLGKGLSQISNAKPMPDGTLKALSTITKDITNVQDLRDALRGLNSEQGKTFAAARGRGDKNGQIEALRNQYAALTNVMQEAAKAGLKNSPLYDRAEDRISRIQEKIAGLQGSLSSAAEKKTYKDNTRLGENAIKDEYRRAQEKLKQTEIDEAAANAIPQRVARESALNKVYEDRKRILEESRDKFRQMDIEQTKSGRGDLADRAMRAGLVQNNQVNQVDVERARMESKRQIETQKEIQKSKRLADAAAAKSGNRNFGRALRLDDNTTKLQLAQNKADEAASKALPDRAAREAELNRVLSERSRIYQEQQQRLQQLSRTQGAAGNADNAAKAEAASLKAGQNAAGVGVSQIKADSDAQIAAKKKSDSDQKKADADARSDRESAFNREMQDIKAHTDKRIAEINAQERRLRAATKSAEERSRISQAAYVDRVEAQGFASQSYQGVENRSRAAGHTSVSDSARGKRLGAETAAARDMEKFTNSTAKSGHALNFHSSALLRNAATFARWAIPVQGVLALTSAFNAGVQGAIKVDRQFATLKAVFRGTAEEAQRLKNETLDLAVSQGRSTDEALDSSIRWSRLGLTRIQVLEATRVSLMAANVAEISAAEAAEKLSGIYATYRLNIGDLAGVLNRLNSISNNYNVTVDDLFQGISRVSGVAKQSGLALRDLEGIIGSVVGAGGGTGAEVGNAIKFVISRLGDTKVGDKLREAFDIDLNAPNGDLKEMSQIIQELATLYPTLNKAQQQSFLQIAAGARQASRFSKVMTEYRQGQILAAKAGFDHAASMRENENILQSLQSRIDSLAASWTSLFTAMGDAGVFDFVEERLRAIQLLVDKLRGGGSDGGTPFPFIINSPATAKIVQTNGGGEDPLTGVRTDFKKEEVTTALENLKLIDESWVKYFYTLNLGSGAVDQLGMDIKKLNEILESGGDSGVKDEMLKITNQAGILRDELESLPQAAGVFESLGADYAAGTADRETMIRQFQSMSYLLTQLDDGQNVYNNSLADFNRILATGDQQQMGDFLKSLGKPFRDKGQATAENLKSFAGSEQIKLGQKLAMLEAKKNSLSAAPVTGDDALREKEQAVNAVNAEIKNVTATVENLNDAASKIDDIMKSAFSGAQVSNINKFFEDLKAQAEAVGEAFKDFAPDAANDPIERIFQRRRRAAGLALEFSRQTLAATTPQTEANKAGAQEKIDGANLILSGGAAGEAAAAKTILEEQKKFIQQQDESVVRAQEQVRLREEELALLVRKLDYEEQIARSQRIYMDASKAASARSEAYLFGETESDKLLNQSRLLLDSANFTGFNAVKDAQSGKGDNASRSSALGKIAQEEVIVRENLDKLTSRQYQLEAARKQVAIDTVIAMREQTEEASKRLMLASREDQLRAAALARTIRDKGPVKDNEFYALSQESRQAFSNYLPNKAPDALNDAKLNADKSYREIDRERAKLASSIGDVSGRLEKLAQAISKNTLASGALDIVPTPPPRSIQDTANTPRDASPLVNLQVGDVNVNVRLGEEMERIMTGQVRGIIVSELRAIEARLNLPPTPNAQGAVE